MSIEVGDGEFTFTISDLIQTLSKLDNFKLKIWVSNVELPFTYTEKCDFVFLQESIRVTKDNHIEYVLYDYISYLKVVI